MLVTLLLLIEIGIFTASNSDNCMALFYCPSILNDYCLPEAESMHCVRVLRLQKGDQIEVMDGNGHFYKAVITDPQPRQCRFEVLEQWEDRTGPYHATVAVCPTKNPERIEWFIEKATEVGIHGFAFIRSRYSERKALKTERVERIIISAMKQSVKAIKPVVQELAPFESFVKQPFEGQKFICNCQPGKKPLLNSVCQASSPALILIGPEGDFSQEEVALAEANGFVSVSLGSTRLRTETAAFVAAHIVLLKNTVDPFFMP
jgi:16S rRNA (uracil1498-N3)-methyltransferase